MQRLEIKGRALGVGQCVWISSGGGSGGSGGGGSGGGSGSGSGDRSGLAGFGARACLAVSTCIGGCARVAGVARCRCREARIGLRFAAHRRAGHHAENPSAHEGLCEPHAAYFGMVKVTPGRLILLRNHRCRRYLRAL
ncbi:MAG TPA: hypothetical protein ENK31_00150 [Nannocystis exedens]|nr:hypothetical protein [Nannocystis exedens]